MALFVVRKLVLGLIGVLWSFYSVVGAQEQLKFMLILPWSGPFPIGPFIGGAFPLAIDDVYSNRKFSNLTSRYSVTWTAYDSKCPLCDSLNLTIFSIVTEAYKTSKTPLVVFGVAFDCEYVGLITSAFDVQFISPLCFDTRLEDSDVFSSFSRTVGSGSYWATSLVKVIEKFRWERIAVVTSGDETVLGTLEELHKKLKGSRAEIVEIHVAKTDVNNMRLYLRNNRVFILLLREMQTAVEILEMASELKVLNVKDYTFILVQFRFDSRHFFQHKHLLAKTNGLLLLNVASPPNDVEWQRFQKRVVRAFAEDQHFDDLDKIMDYTSIVPPAGHLYETVMLWATVANKALSFPSGSEFHNLSGAKLTSMMKNIEFEGVGRTRRMDSRGGIDDNFTLNIVQNERLVPIASFVAKDRVVSEDFHALDTNDQIVWAGNSKEWPTGQPPCGWNDPDCVQRDRIRMIVVLCAVFFVSTTILILGFVCLCRILRLRSHKSDISMWLVDWNNLQLLPERSLPHRNTIHSQHKTIPGQRKTIDILPGLRYLKDAIHADWLDGEISSHDSHRSSVPSFYQQLFTVAGTLDNTKVAIKTVPSKNMQPDNKNLIDDIEQMRHLRYENLNEFVGVCLNPNHTCILTIYAGKGSLMDVLRDETINLSWDFKFPLACDISKGMVYLHKSDLGSHGHLTSRNCLVDSRWVCKVTDYGMGHIREPPLQKPYTKDTCHALLWTAPELLRQKAPDRPIYGTKAGDVYSFGIIMQEITVRDKPFRGRIRPDLSPEDILDRVSIVETPPFRPVVATSQCKKNWCDLMQQCWEEDLMKRPTFSVVLLELQIISGKKSMNVVDNMLKMLEMHAENLEELIEERQTQLDVETKRVASILNNIFPRSVVTQLMLGDRVTPETFEMVTIYFSDIFEFVAMCSQSTPMQIIDLLNDVYILFDEVTDTYDVYKVETINDSYLVASGLPIRNVIHATEIATMALDLLNAAGTFEIAHLPNDKLFLRIGINSGTVVAGVVGLQQPRYCIFGDTVNTASRMESSGLPLQIHITSSTARLLENNDKFKVVPRGETTVKGKGIMKTYWLRAGENFQYPIRVPKATSRDSRTVMKSVT